MNKLLSIELANNLSELRRLMELCEELFAQNDIPMKVSKTVELALEEIITNIVSYGYDDMNDHLIGLEIFLAEKELIAIIADDARQFNPLSRPGTDVTKPLEEKAIGGLGIHLVRSLIDEIEYSYVDGKNILKLKKHL